MANYQLAQLNIAKARDAMDSNTMQGFVERLDEINALAERSPGFVWRLTAPAGDKELSQLFDDPDIIVNMSVWEGLESLKHYVYKSMHVELIRGREAWFHKIPEAHQVLWWVPEGHIPTAAEANDRLLHLREHGPSVEAFTFAKPF